MAHKSRFGPELTEAEIDASDPGGFNKQLFYSGLLNIK